MSDRLNILLIQAREPDDPMARHELEAFSSRCGLDEQQFSTFNIAADRSQQFSLEGADGVMVGGSGNFSLVEGGFEWHHDFLELMRQLLNSGIPVFASCFGFQGIVQALGGRLARHEQSAELGTFSIELTDAADGDPLFGDLPEQFDAQLGHNDSAVELCDELIHLARSDRCEYQAIRVKDRPVVATQFHPELTREDNLDRFRNYLKNYKKPGQNLQQAIEYAERIHRQSPHACGLLQSFVRDLQQRRGCRLADRPL